METGKVYYTHPVILDVETRKGDIFEPGELVYYNVYKSDEGFLTRNKYFPNQEADFVVVSKTKDGVTRVQSLSRDGGFPIP